MRNDRLKRMMDLIIASVGFLVTAPFLLLVASLILVIIGRPVIFTDIRPGLFGIPFKIYKFRTMTSDCDERGSLLPDELRLTKLGRFLRRTSLDELPQLCNVLKGDMSLVGPRPLLMEYLPLYTPEQARRHEVKPGMVGWAGVNGRNCNTWQKKFEMDVWYVDNWSITLDLRILAQTILVVLSTKGVNEDGCATASQFTGNREST